MLNPPKKLTGHEKIRFCVHLPACNPHYVLGSGRCLCMTSGLLFSVTGVSRETTHSPSHCEVPVWQTLCLGNLLGLAESLTFNAGAVGRKCTLSARIKIGISTKRVDLFGTHACKLEAKRNQKWTADYFSCKHECFYFLVDLKVVYPTNIFYNH